MSDSEKNISTCPNCGEPMWPDSSFCSDCGQKAYQGPPSFWHLMGEFFETVFSLDNRLFRTLAALMIPGRLTNNFLSGKQKPYFHPLRLFFVSGVLMVATYSFVTTQGIGDKLEIRNEESRAIAYESKYGLKLQEGVDSIRATFPAPIVQEATDSLLTLLKFSTTDSFSIGYPSYADGMGFTDKKITFSSGDYDLLTPSDLVDKYKIEGTFDQFLIKQIVRLTHLGVSDVSLLMGQAIWGLLLLVPLSAGMLKLIYIRHKRKYVEHFIFTLYTHAFLFLTQFFAALELLISGTHWLLILSGIAVVVYFLLAMKRVYGQSWVKTVIKAVLISLSYLFLLPLVTTIAALMAVLFF
ncbi:MAG: hypothetical protein ACI81P_001831 [Neolewinella sp.]|jgi:hypothetical protein